MNMTYRAWTIEFSLLWLIASILAMALFFSLGCWQLQRYQDKQAWVEAQLEGTVEGTFLPSPLIYIDNKIMHHAPGYEVLQGFELKNSTSTQEVVLISRGWVAQPKNAQEHYDRSHLPLITTPNPNHISMPLHLKTKIIKIFEPKYGITHLESFKTAGQTTTIRVSRLDISEIKKFFDNKNNKFNLITTHYYSLPKDSEYQLSPLPEVSTWLNPHKHLGYAVQWFAFCLITLFLFIRFGMRAIKTSSQKSSTLLTGKID